MRSLPEATIVEMRDSHLNYAQAHSIFTLYTLVFPLFSKETDRLTSELLEKAARDPLSDHDTFRWVIWEGDQALVHAQVFRRRIYVEGGSLIVGALSGVACHPEVQGQGYGRAITQAAFSFLFTGLVEVFLFQTGVPGFYEKLGGRRVTNRFVNRQNPENPEANPWWDQAVMIYPKDYPWPEGTIDLNGPGY